MTWVDNYSTLAKTKDREQDSVKGRQQGRNQGSDKRRHQDNTGTVTREDITTETRTVAIAREAATTTQGQ